MTKTPESRFYAKVPAAKTAEEKPVFPANDMKTRDLEEGAQPFDFKEHIRIWD